MSDIDCFCAPHRLPRPLAAPSSSGDLTESSTPPLSRRCEVRFATVRARQQRISGFRYGCQLPSCRQAEPTTSCRLQWRFPRCALSSEQLQIRRPSAPASARPLETPSSASPERRQDGCSDSLHSSADSAATGDRRCCPLAGLVPLQRCGYGRLSGWSWRTWAAAQAFSGQRALGAGGDTDFSRYLRRLSVLRRSRRLRSLTQGGGGLRNRSRCLSDGIRGSVR